jgi:DNA-binding transcriptional LysR family regulator
MEYQSDRALAELSALVAVVEHRGFSAAARSGGLRKATLSERVRSLEERLGVPLLVRTTRSLRLTDEGRGYVEQARIAIEAARKAETAALATRSSPSGTLRMSVSPAIADVLMAHVVAPYLREHPNVSVELDASIRLVDFAREGFDLAVRVGPLADSSLVARRLGRARGGYYASPAYLERRGAPKRPEDLHEHDVIAMTRGDRLPEWHFASGARKRSVVVRPRVVVSTFELGLGAAIAGLGVVPCPRHVARPLVARGDLAPVLASWTPHAFEISAVFSPGAAHVPKTRAMIDRLVAWFAKRTSDL